jgi:hypothetical protein
VRIGPVPGGHTGTMSILGRLMGTAETAARGAARGGRTTTRPGRGMARPTTARRGLGRRTTAAPAAAGGLGGMVQGLLRRR